MFIKSNYTRIYKYIKELHIVGKKLRYFYLQKSLWGS